jgi:FKBP-type peptidyl-prolyl cis-trans isomerase FklB
MRKESVKRRFSALGLSAAIFATGLVMAGGAASQQSSAAAQTPSSTAPKTSKPASSSTATKSTASSATKSTTGATAPALTTNKQKDSYALGANIGRQLAGQHLTPEQLDSIVFLRGFRDALAGGAKPLELSDDQIKAALADLQNAGGEANLKKGEEFLAENKAKPGVVTTPSGLQYKIIKAGTGPKPAATDTVLCDYRGTLIDGKEFDSSYKRGQAAAFPVNRVIKGWTEALQMMPVGSKWELFIPPDLAYGANGAGPDIGPNATLVFEVELHSIKGK